MIQQAIADFRTSPADTELLAEALTEHARLLARGSSDSDVPPRGDGRPDVFAAGHPGALVGKCANLNARKEVLEALELFDRTAYPDQKAVQLAKTLERQLRR